MADDANDEEVTAAVADACPEYPNLKAGTNFDPETFTVLDEEHGPDPHQD